MCSTVGIKLLFLLNPFLKNIFFSYRTREDTVRCIVTSLTDENSTELAEVIDLY